MRAVKVLLTMTADQQTNIPRRVESAIIAES